MNELKVLPATRYPEQADEYECDKCGRLITRYLHKGRAHVERPIGRERYFCRCGQSYLSGSTEWDHLRDAEKRRRIKMLWFSLTRFFLPSLISVAFACVALQFRIYWLLALWVIAAIPTFVFLCLSAVSLFELVPIAASLRRTRVGAGFGSRRGLR